jgi:hypothetical protein
MPPTALGFDLGQTGVDGITSRAAARNLPGARAVQRYISGMRKVFMTLDPAQTTPGIAGVPMAMSREDIPIPLRWPGGPDLLGPRSPDSRN